MKLNQIHNQTQTFDPWNLRGRLPMTPVWKDPKKAGNRMQEMRNIQETVGTANGEMSFRTYASDGYPYYIDPNNDPATNLKRPKPPTAEMIKRAQPYRADILEQDCVIKDPQHRFNG